MRNLKPVHRSLIAGTGVLGALVLSACGAADTGDSSDSATDGETSSSYETIVIAEPNWVGAAANVAVASYVLENELGYDVEAKQINETAAFDGMDDGSIHAALEDWGGAPDKEQLYVEEKKSVFAAGDLGVIGHIGWFIPKAYADANPEATTWEGLNGLVEDFKTAETGDKGQLLNGDPSYTSYDKALVEQLGLDYEVVEAGSEDAQVTAIKQAHEDGTPLLTYWWTPHWLNAEIPLVEVELPEYTEGCQDDPETVACGYPDTPLQKFLNADFAESGDPAAEFLKTFQWETSDQEYVAKLIQGEGMDPQDAAKQWVEENQDKVDAWLPEQG